MSKNLFFTVKSGLKDIIGKDLITDDNIAIFELVKNSYDAHAQDVIITFDKNKIIIADNGKGMSEKDLINKWLAVAYSAKKDGTEDIEESENTSIEKRNSYRDKIQAKRFYAGAKGIGRFSCDRLGNKLTLVTRKIGSTQINQLDVNWHNFDENSTDDFAKIAIPYKELKEHNIQFPNKSRHGTILEIQNTRKWSREEIRNLKHSLEKLINPFSEKNDFYIEIICERELEMDKLGVDNKGKIIVERDKINGIVNNSILDILKLKTTQIQIIVDESNIETKLFDRGTLIYHIKEKNKYNPFIDNLKIDLYYLNRSAKTNFGKRMGIQPIQYGSVFLFKNGFRVQPYGDTGDDSWGLDFRAQQGYSRYLSTRDLFGRVDITTENSVQFKEVSSRDGGLVATSGFKQLMEAFKENGLKRLERYVVGVLWGEAFKKNKYFTSNDEAQKFRDALLEKDKDSEDFSVARSNIGSKIDFIRLVKSLADDKDIDILEFNKDLVDLVNENLEMVQPKFIKDLEKLAETTGDEDLWRKVNLTAEAFLNLEKEKEDAERKAKDEEKKRIIAERKAKDEEEKRIIAEQKARDEEEKRRKAELDTANKEKERALAELAKYKAEQKAKEEEGKRKEAEEKQNKAQSELDIEKQKTTYLSANRRVTAEVEDIIHTIKISSHELEGSSRSLLSFFKSTGSKNREALENLSHIQFHIDRINKFSSLLTKADISFLKEHVKMDIPVYVKEYLLNYSVSISKIHFNEDFNDSFIRKISSLDLSVILDNLVSNSKKSGATEIYVNFKKEDKKLYIDFSDNGDGVVPEFIENNSIFEIGVTNRRGGSGIGLSSVKERLNKNLFGDIVFLGNNLQLKGATFRLIF